MIKLIGITGGTGSGKTFIANKISNLLPHNSVSILSQDHYYKPREEQIVDDFGYENFDLPSALDLEKLVADLQTLKQGNAITLQTYTYNNAEHKSSALVVEAKPYIIIEGIFLLHHPLIRQVLEYSIFVNAPEKVRKQRRISRDQKERGYNLEDVQHRFTHHIIPSEKTYLQPFIQFSDITINNNYNSPVNLQRVLDEIVANR